MSAAVYLNKGVQHTSTVKRRGRVVKFTFYRPNATLKSTSGTMTIDLSKIKPGSYTCKVEVTYRHAVNFKGIHAILPYTSTITENLRVTAG